MTDPRALDQPGAHGQNTGHGHVYPRPDRTRTRCGGPRRCSTCQADVERKQVEDRVSLAMVVHAALADAGALGADGLPFGGSLCENIAAAVTANGWHR